MHRSWVIASTFILMSAVGIPHVFSMPDGRSSGAGEVKLTPNLRRDLRVEAGARAANARHRVIVSLVPEPRRGRGSFSGGVEARMSMAAHRTRVAARQAEFTRHFDSLTAERLIRRYRNIPALAMTLTAHEIERLAAHPMVETIGRMEVYRKVSAESHPLTGVDVAQASGFSGRGVRVAVIDDGIRSDHPAFGGESGFPTARIVGGFDFADGDGDPRNDCAGQGHGTAVAGIVAGNGGGVTGVAPQADLVFLKVQSASICGQAGLDGDLVGAIDWVVTNRNSLNIGVISMSLGAGAFSTVNACEKSSPSLTNVLNQAAAVGIVTFAASGNGGLCQQMSRPACVGSVISVGATYDADIGNRGFCVSPDACVATSAHSVCAQSGRQAAFEGGTFPDKVTLYSNSASFLDLLAPSHCAFTASTQGGTRDCFGGTSAATPFAAGTAALVLQAAGGWNALNRPQMLPVLQDNGDGVTDGRMGRLTPRVNAAASVNAVVGVAEICSDGVDSDGDGATDCADLDCAGDPACGPVPGPT